jgi:hypothetical protein
MPRRVTPSQFRSKVRQAQAKHRQAINRYNQQVRQHNARVKRGVDDYNREVDKYNAALRKQAREVDAYNRKVNAHNARVRRDRQRLVNELKRMERQASSTRYVPLQTSVRVLNEAYGRVDLAAETESWNEAGVALADLAETETANSAAAANALLGDQAEPGEETSITDELSVVSDDLDKRWRGALFALDSRNPDAARHFCTSSREILTRIIDIEAPDDVVLSAVPNCARTDDGRPIRRDKIGYLLNKSGADHESLRDFVESDVDDVMSLFRVFNDATHGDAGTLDMNALRALKHRVEGAIRFLSAIVRPAAAGG